MNRHQRLFRKLLVMAAAWVAGVAGPASAAEIAAVPHQINGQTVPFIYVTGTLQTGDAERFASLANQNPGAVVLMSGSEGRLVVGLALGRVINDHGLTTLVTEGLSCTSACALAWLGGVDRLMAAGDRVGFHSAVELNLARNQGPVPVTFDIIEYLNGLGLPSTARNHIIRAGPQVRWLSFADANQIGLPVRRYTDESDIVGPGPVAGPPPVIGPPPGGGSWSGQGEWIQIFSSADRGTAIDRATQFDRQLGNVTVFLASNGWYAGAIGPYPVGTAASERDRLKAFGRIPSDSFITRGTKYVDIAWGGPGGPVGPIPPSGPSGPGNGSLVANAEQVAESFFQVSSTLTLNTIGLLEQIYADEVDYFGKRTSLAAVVQDKRNFLIRWPERSYTVVPGSLDTHCRAGAVCTVTGQIDWRNYSPSRNSSSVGRASFELEIAMSTDVRVIGEDSEVIERRIFSGR